MGASQGHDAPGIQTAGTHEVGRLGALWAGGRPPTLRSPRPVGTDVAESFRPAASLLNHDGRGRAVGRQGPLSYGESS